MRWIVDYKTGTHEGGDLDAFLDNREIRLGLYFPLLKGWREWVI